MLDLLPHYVPIGHGQAAGCGHRRTPNVVFRLMAGEALRMMVTNLEDALESEVACSLAVTCYCLVRSLPSIFSYDMLCHDAGIPKRQPQTSLPTIMYSRYILALRGAIVLRRAFFSSVSSTKGRTPWSLIFAKNSWPYLYPN